MTNHMTHTHNIILFIFICGFSALNLCVSLELSLEFSTCNMYTMYIDGNYRIGYGTWLL